MANSKSANSGSQQVKPGFWDWAGENWRTSLLQDWEALINQAKTDFTGITYQRFTGFNNCAPCRNKTGRIN